MGLVRSFIGTDGIWQYIPHINTGLFSIIKVHFLLFANLIVDWHINTINFTDSGLFLIGTPYIILLTIILNFFYSLLICF